MRHSINFVDENYKEISKNDGRIGPIICQKKYAIRWKLDSTKYIILISKVMKLGKTKVKFWENQDFFYDRNKPSPEK